MTGNRRPLYLSPVKDQDILSYIEPLVDHYNFSLVVRELIRDGIKYRTDVPESKNVIQSNTSTKSPSLQHVELKKKEINDDDIESRLDNF